MEQNRVRVGERSFRQRGDAGGHAGRERFHDDIDRGRAAFHRFENLVTGHDGTAR